MNRQHPLFCICLSAVLATTAQDLIQQADQALNNTLYEDAAVLYQKALTTTSDPDLQSTLQYRMAIAQVTAGQYEQALKTLKTLPEPTAPETRTLLANIKSQLSRYSTGLDALKPLPSTPEMLLLQSQLLALQGQLTQPDYLLFLKGQILAQQRETNPSEVIQLFEEIAAKYPKGRYADAALRVLGFWCMQNGKLEKAKEALLQLQQQYPKSAYAAEGLFWAARCAEQSGADLRAIQLLLSQLFNSYPHSPLAAEAYFTYYPHADYLSGQEKALAHLCAMPNRFPASPYTITAHYLLGMNSQKVRQTPNNRQRVNWNQSIQEFQCAEALFDQLHQQGLIPKDQLDYLLVLRYRAALERAKANLQIALESAGSKRQICIAYSTSCYHEILNALSTPNLSLQGEAHPHLLEECRYGLAQTYLKGEADADAEQLLQQMIDEYRLESVTRGYFLACCQQDLASLYMKRGDYHQALKWLNGAEEASKGRILNTDERLNLWIQQAICHQTLENHETAMRLLSKVINDDSVSSLRLKAMFMRAESYEQQGRLELAQKQLVALSQKGGVWAQKAKEKLIKDYEYHE